MLKRNPDALWTEMGKQLAVLSMTSGRYFEVQGCGANLWRWLEHACEPDSLAARLVKEFQVSTERAQEDVSRFLAELRDAGLLVDSATSAD